MVFAIIMAPLPAVPGGMSGSYRRVSLGLGPGLFAGRGSSPNRNGYPQSITEITHDSYSSLMETTRA